MAQHIEMIGKDMLCTSDVYKDLLNAFKAHDTIKIDNILSNSEVNPDHRYEDPEYGTLLLLCAMKENYSDMISILLKHGANPNLIDPLRGKGPIHFSCQIADFYSLSILVKCLRTDIDLLDSTGSSALHYAVRQNDTEAKAVKLLIEYNADLNLLNRKGRTPLHIALNEQNLEAILALIQAGANLSIIGRDGTTLEEDITSAYPNIKLPFVLNENGENAKNEITHGQLFVYLRANRFDEFRQIIKENKHLLEENDGYHTYLQYCCENGFPDIVDFLLKLGACPNTHTDVLKLTPLMLAARRGDSKIIRLLLCYDTVDFSPIDEQTVLHCVMNGIQSPFTTDSDSLECLNLLLTMAPKTKLNINQQDFKGNTALHYAAKYQQHKMVLLLLRNGAYIGVENCMGQAACADIDYKTFSEHLDSCISTNDALPRGDNYEITFNYAFLLPIDWNTDEQMNNVDPENRIHINNSNKYLRSESMPLLHISKNRELRPLLKHPIFTSFLQLKWHRIRHYFYINLCFYLLFWAFLTTYILQYYSNENTDNYSKNNNNTTISQINNVNNNHNTLWIKIIISLLLGLLFLRELLQFYISRLKYLINFENWLEIALIIITIIILFYESYVLIHVISAIGIMLSWTELVLLIGRHPALSTNIEMLKTVSYNFLKFLAWYSILIIAFALSFYSLFKDSVIENEEENIFEDPGKSLFKTVVMITGEFDTGSIPFVEQPITSRILFVLFVFLIAIVLFNLLNGLAVSDTQAIRDDAELVSIISRTKLVSYFETTLANPSSIIEALAKCLHKPISSINLASSLSQDHTVKVLINMGCRLANESMEISYKNKRDPSKRVEPCLSKCIIESMDRTIIEKAEYVLRIKSEREILKKEKEQEKKKEKLLKEKIEYLENQINNQTEMIQEYKKILDSISLTLSNLVNVK